MTKKTEKQDITFSIKGVELLETHIEQLKSPIIGAVKFNFNINVEIKILNDNNLLFSIVTVEISDLETSVKYGSLKVNIIFSIENINPFINSKTSRIVLPKNFVTSINSISISTTRGVMFGVFRGTFLHGATLPIIDPTFLSEQKTVELGKKE